MSTHLDASFLRAVCLMTGFKAGPMKQAQAALLLIGLRQYEFSATDLPADITNGSRHIAGAACGSLLTQELIEVTRRIKSPVENAKGRKLDVFRIPAHRVPTVRAWLRANGYAVEEVQAELFA